MRILCVIQRFFPVVGGAEILSKSLLDFLSDSHEITVFTTNAKEIGSFWNHDGEKITTNEIPNYPVKRFDFLLPDEIKSDENFEKFSLSSNYPGPFSPSLWNALITKRPNYDLIFVTAFPYDHSIPAFISAKKWKIPIIIMPLLHQEFPELYLTAFRLAMIDNSDSIFVLSKSEKNLLVKKQIDENKISIISPFLPRVSIELNNYDFYNYASIPKTKKIILFVGSKSLVKGTMFLINTMKEIWKTQKEVVLVLLGPSTNEFEEYYKKLSKNTKKNIFNFNEVDEDIKNSALIACHALAVPSISESFGLVYLEAWNFKKPVIGCNISSTSEIIENKKDGLLVEFDNITQLKENLLFLIENSSECEKMGDAGRVKFDLIQNQNSFGKIEKHFKTIIQNFNN